jgi:HAD superfamily hydrolase (TIGR01450 family)
MPERLRDSYDALLLDLDGTLFRGHDAIPEAVTALAAAPERLVYVTNNASRGAPDVAAHLRALGYPVTGDDVVTSAQAAARLLAERLPPAGRSVLVVGTDALAAEVAALGFRPVRSAVEQPVAVIQGHSPETAWPILAEASYAIRGGALWVAANTDATLPTERGLAPGNGAMVAALRAATGVEPLVAGKPYPPLLRAALRQAGDPPRPLVVGDRLDTDIEGANRIGVDSLLVLTGVSTLDDLRAAPRSQHPTYVAATMAGLDAPPRRYRPEADPADADADPADVGRAGAAHG